MEGNGTKNIEIKPWCWSNGMENEINGNNYNNNKENNYIYDRK